MSEPLLYQQEGTVITLTLNRPEARIREGQHQRLDSLLELSAALQALAHHTRDHQEAVAALLEKRPGRFTGE